MQISKYFSHLSLIVLLGGLCFFIYLSQFFSYEIPWLERPNLLLVAVMIVMGAAYLFLVNNLVNTPTYSAITIVLMGLIIRILFLYSTPVYEDDFYRYFWDAELSSQGINPYTSAPIEAMPSPFEIDQVQSVDYLDRVAYPAIRTIYPPLTQAVFALAHWISPGDLNVWRLILLVVDCLGLGMLLLLLRELGKNASLIGIYWLNPLLIIETMGAAHMDVLLMPFLIGSALFLLRKQHAISGVLLACAVGIKLWPILFAPLLFRSCFTSPKRLLENAWPFLILCLMFITPQLLSRLDDQSGLVRYALSWNTNAFIFPYIHNFFELILGEETTGILNPDFIARLSVVFIVLSVLLYLMKKPITLRESATSSVVNSVVNSAIDKKVEKDPENIIENMLIITSVLLLLSPTGYPWYYLWLLPWLTLIPYKPILLLTATLPLYYLRYLFEVKGMTQSFNEIIVTLEFLPSIMLASYCYIRSKKRRNALT